MEDRIILRRQDHVAWLIFNRPDRLNAMTIKTWQLMGRHLASLSEDRDMRCLVLAGEGRAFLAGHDVAEIREHNELIASGKLSPAAYETLAIVAYQQPVPRSRIEVAERLVQHLVELG